MTTKSEFDGAAERLLGHEKYKNLLDSGYIRPDFCREIAQDEFIGNLASQPDKPADLELVQSVAHRLWKGDGITGLEE